MKVKVESAIELSVDQRKDLEVKLGQILGKSLQIEYVTNPALLGGLRIVSKNKTLDMSLAARLTQLSNTLINQAGSQS